MFANEWRPIKGYEGKYEINPSGEVRAHLSCFGREYIIIKSPHLDKDHYVMRFKEHGRTKVHQLSKLVADAFMPPAPHKGMIIFHKNGSRLDNHVGNLEWIDKSTLAQIAGGRSHSRAIVKKTPRGKIVNYYRTSKQAAKENFMNYHTILDYCNKRVKKYRTAPDGYVYEWDRSDEQPRKRNQKEA